jgi:hypothetical protein
VEATLSEAEVSVFEPVGVALEGDDFGVVDEAVDHRRGDHVVAEQPNIRPRAALNSQTPAEVFHAVTVAITA